LASKPRKKLATDIRHLVLHVSGYKCGNPVCRMPLTLEIHHLDPVSNGGEDTPENLLALCPNCHTLHHNGSIPIESLRAWKLLLLSLNEAFDKKSVDILLTVHLLGELSITGDGLLECAALLTSGLIRFAIQISGTQSGYGSDIFKMVLSEKGKKFVEGWKAGDQKAAIV
jgi:hypothetical protein